MKPPCKDCPDRTTGERTTDCHTTCEKYAAFHAAREAALHAQSLLNEAKGASVDGFERVQRIQRNRLWSSRNR